MLLILTFTDNFESCTFAQQVVFKLHDSFPNPVRVIDKPPFELTETGWGEFEIGFTVCD